MITGISAGIYPAAREKILPFLQGFVDRDYAGLTVEDLERGILDKTRQVWVIGDFKAVVLTNVTPEAVGITHGAGSDRHEWEQEFEALISEWARAQGKKRVISMARPGWCRDAKKRGWKETHREMVMELVQ